MIKGLKVGFWFGFIVLLVLSTSAAAATATTAPSTTIDSSSARRLSLAAGLRQGTSSLSNAVPGATSSSGSRTELMLLASVELGSLILEGGGGWMHDRLSGTAQPVGFSPTEYELVTDAGIAEFSPRLKVVGGLEIGPVVELLVGPDVGFSPSFISSGNDTAWLGGGQALYGFRVDRTTIRAGARFMTSLNIPEHTLQSVQASLQVGLPVL